MRLSQAVKTSIQQAFQDRLDLLDKAKQAMGETLLEFIKVAYIQKARGRTDATGESWLPTKDFLKGQGWMLLKTGRLFNSLKVKVTDNGFKIVFDVDYGAIQFQKRHPVPRKIPEEWLTAMIEAAKPYIRDIIITGINRVERLNIRSIETKD